MYFQLFAQITVLACALALVQAQVDYYGTVPAQSQYQTTYPGAAQAQYHQATYPGADQPQYRNSYSGVGSDLVAPNFVRSFIANPVGQTMQIVADPASFVRQAVGDSVNFIQDAAGATGPRTTAGRMPMPQSFFAGSGLGPLNLVGSLAANTVARSVVQQVLNDPMNFASIFLSQ